jgi:hypothetical protein
MNQLCPRAANPNPAFERDSPEAGCLSILGGCLSKQRYTLIDRQKLTALLGIKDNDQLSEYHRNWAEEVLKNVLKWLLNLSRGIKIMKRNKDS